jgi:hypothetical protein
VRLFEYSAALGPGGQITDIQVTIRPGLAGSQPTVGWEARLRNGQLTVVNRRDTVDSATFAVQRASIPFLQLSLGLYQAAVQRALHIGGDSIPFDMYGFGARQPTATYVARRGSDSLEIGYFGDPMYVAVGADGRVRGLNGMRTTQKFIAEPVASLDLEGVAEQFIARERAGAIAGPASPRDTARASVGGASLIVDYGRPSRRGRRIFGEVVPFDQVWRTGANAATQFSTDLDLLVGGTRIAAGRYTFWTLPTAQGATLIINRQTGQWGTQYDPAMDVVRLPMRVEPLAEEVERFTIGIASTAAGGELRFDWDRTRWSLRFAVAARER